MLLMTAPASGVKVRMYRQGHGDCFLLAFATGKPQPAYVLIDCGFKPRSKVHADIATVVKDKVGHHGSHNATLDGTTADDCPNLSWMAQGKYGLEFVAMITAVSEWAYAQDPVWAHPLESIKTALVNKAAGRVFQTDTDTLQKPGSVSTSEWQKFLKRTKIDNLYFEYEITD